MADDLPDAPWTLPDAPWLRTATAQAPQQALPPGFELDAPRFDPTKPYEEVGAPQFDPNKPFQVPAGGKDEWQDFRLPPGYVLDQPAPTPSTPSGDRWAATVARAKAYGADIGKQALAGATAGIAGLPGILGDVQRYMDSVAAQNPAVNQRALAEMRAGPLGTMPTSAETIGAAEHYGGFKLPPPETVPGQYARTVGEFVPNLAGGGEGLATRLLSRTVAPGLASEAAGQATEGTAAEPWARIIGAVAGGGLAARVARPGALEAPTIAELKDASRTAYRSPEVGGVQIKPAAVSDLGTKIESDLVGSGFREKIVPKTFSVLDDLQPSQGVQSVGVADLDSARKALGQIVKEGRAVPGGPTAEAAAASRAIEHIDSFLPNLRAADLLSGDAQAANAVLQEARSNWGAAKRTEALDRAQYVAANNAAAANSGMNVENSLRQQLKSILNNPKRAAQFNDAERAQMQSIVRGEGVRNAVRTAGNLLGGGGGLGAAAAGYAGHTIVPGLGWATPLVGAGLKMAGNAVTGNRLNALTRNVAMNSPLGQARAAANPQPVHIGAIEAAARAGGLAARTAWSGDLGSPTPGTGRLQRNLADEERQLQERDLEDYIQRKYGTARGGAIPQWR